MSWLQPPTTQDYKDFCVAYRGKLAQIARATAQLLPAQAMDAAARRLGVVLPMCAAGSGADAMQQRTQLEASVVFLEAVVTAVADAHLGAAAARNPANAQGMPIAAMWHVRCMRRLCSLPVNRRAAHVCCLKGCHAVPSVMRAPSQRPLRVSSRCCK